MTGAAEAEIEFDCPGCAARLRVPSSVAGRDVRCPACDHLFRAPMSPPPVPATTIAEASLAESVAEPVAEPVVEPVVEPVSQPVVEPVVEQAAMPRDVSGFEAESADAQWWMRTPEGLNYGPASRSTVERWVREGRVTGDCQLCTNLNPAWRAADSLFPALQTPPVALGAFAASAATGPRGPARSVGASAGNVKIVAVPTPPPTSLAAQLAPHRGPLILTLGLVGLLVQCPIFSVMAWVMGSSDLDEMARGRMDPSGASLTRSGRMLGLVLSFIWIIMAVVSVAFLIFYVAVRG